MSTTSRRDKGGVSVTPIPSLSLSADQVVCQAMNQPVSELFPCPRASFLLLWIPQTPFLLLLSYRQHYYFWRKLSLIGTGFLRFSLYTKNYSTSVSTMQAGINSSLLWKGKWLVTFKMKNEMGWEHRSMYQSADACSSNADMIPGITLTPGH